MEPPATALGAGHGAPGASSAAPEVLVADADASVTGLLLAALERAGLRAAACAEAGCLMTRLRAFRPRLLILERSLPGLDPAALVALLREPGAAVPLLVMAAFLEDGARAELCDAPEVTGLVEKPFDLERLLADVRAALASAGPRVARRAPSRAWFPGASRGEPPPREARAC